jgi:hypothetical protein
LFSKKLTGLTHWIQLQVTQLWHQQDPALTA